jgi:spermidine synthase
MEESWFAEPPFGGYQQRYRVLRRIHAERTDWQTLEVLDLESVGRTLVLDGRFQTSVGDEFTYHEPLVHVPLCAHPNPRQVLIIGGGDGGALRQVLLHRTVERVVQVEIDRGVVDVAKRFLPEISGGAFDDPRVELHIADGADFIGATSERFDVVLVDSTDPVGPAAPLIGAAFLGSAREILNSPGLMVMQSGSPLTQPREWVATVSAFKRTFPMVRPYLGWVPIYPGVLWSWVAGSRDLDPAAIDDITVSARLEGVRGQLHIYNPGVHRAAFALPTFVQKLAEQDRSPTAGELRGIGHPLPAVVPD